MTLRLALAMAAFFAGEAYGRGAGWRVVAAWAALGLAALVVGVRAQREDAAMARLGGGLDALERFLTGGSRDDGRRE